MDIIDILTVVNVAFTIVSVLIKGIQFLKVIFVTEPAMVQIAILLAILIVGVCINKKIKRGATKEQRSISKKRIKFVSVKNRVLLIIKVFGQTVIIPLD